jgi:ribosome-associated heat shock protein Hsp15
MQPSLRLDRWLWFARFFKSRAIASRLCAARRVRLNGRVVAKANQQVRPGDVLTFPQARTIRVVRLVALGSRRGPAAEAQGLYEDLDPVDLEPAPVEAVPAQPAGLAREPGTGRPTKAQRRAIDRLREQH